MSKPVNEFRAVMAKTTHAILLNVTLRLKMLALKSRIDAFTKKTHKFWNISMAAFDLGSQIWSCADSGA